MSQSILLTNDVGYRMLLLFIESLISERSDTERPLSIFNLWGIFRRWKSGEIRGENCLCVIFQQNLHFRWQGLHRVRSISILECDPCTIYYINIYVLTSSWFEILVRRELFDHLLKMSLALFCIYVTVHFLYGPLNKLVEVSNNDHSFCINKNEWIINLRKERAKKRSLQQGSESTPKRTQGLLRTRRLKSISR